MEWLEHMNNAIVYIEENLTGKTDYEQIAKTACCSPYHFQRTFTFMTNTTLSEYIRRRKMTKAAFELKNDNIKVIDLAFKYGYDSPEAFSRAFKLMHGVSPTEARKPETNIKSYPPISFHLTIKGDVEMNYRIESKDEFEVFGISTIINANGETPYIEIPKYWAKCVSDGSIAKLRQDAKIDQHTQVHSALYNRAGEQFSYMICYFLTGEVPSYYDKLSVGAHTWVIFTTGVYQDGQGDIQSIWRRLGEWFSNSDYEVAEGPEFEMTYHRGGDLYEQEVWIPIKKVK